MKWNHVAIALIAWMAAAAPAVALEPKLDVSAQMHQVTGIRGLTFLRPVDGYRIDSNELRSRIRIMIDDELPTSVRDYALVLAVLHLTDGILENPVEDLIDLYGEQVVAFYDPETHRFFSVEGAGGEIAALPGMSDAVVVHELVHALQDQRFGAGDAIEARAPDWDASLAYHSLLEGDAMLVMMDSIAGLAGMSLDQIVGNEDLMKMMETMSPTAGGTALDRVPPYFVETMVFPYTRGFRLVAEAYRDGGWEAVDRLYADPPSATSQLLHPGSPVPVEIDALATAGDALVDTTFGELHWSLIVGPEGAAGWRGDRLVVFRDEGDLSVLAETRWSSPEEAREFANALEKAVSGSEPGFRIALADDLVRVGWGSATDSIESFVVRGLKRGSSD